MASPVPDSYSCASGGAIYGGRSGLPAWRSAMAANTWALVGSNTISTIDPEDNAAINPSHPGSAPWHANGGQVNAVAAWCGACFDQTGGVLWLPLGGGHQDYAGNEAYKINLLGDSPAWQMPRNPSGAVGNIITLNDSQEATGNYADGRPRAIHSYNKHVYVPGVGPVLASQGSTAWSGQAGTLRAMSLNETTGEWTTRATHPLHSVAAACYDPTRGRIYAAPTAEGYMTYLDVEAWTWSGNAGTYDGESGNKRVVYMPELDAIAKASTAGFTIWNPTTRVKTTITPSGTPPTGLSLSGTVGMDWDGAKLLLWDNTSNTTVIGTLTPSGAATDPWAWGSLTVSGSNAVTPSAKTTNGTFGRFGYSSVLKGCYLLNAVTEKLYFYATE